MRTIGVTGTIGAGKSTVSRWLAERGAAAIDADALVHHLYESDADLLERWRARFGDAIFREGALHRPSLGALVFGANAAAALADLEAIVHPAVARLRDGEIEAARAAGAPVCVLEAIKLVESGGSARCDELWIVVAAEAVQIERLARRGLAPADARRRLAAQATPAQWIETFLAESARLGRPRPVIVFDNSGSVEDGQAAVARLWPGLLEGERR
jgi:dephospho-CoA kinase